MDLIATPVVFGQSPPENSIVHSTSVSLTNRSPSAPVHLVQYDDTLPIIAVALTSNSQPYTVPSGAAVNVRLAKPDGHYVYDPAYGVSDDGQTVYIAVTVQMTAVSGKVSPIIEVVVNGTVAGTGFFVLDIDPNPIPEDAIESTDEYKTIQQLAAQVQQAAQVVQDNAEGIQCVQENAANITSVAQNGENISAVGESIANVNTVAENLTPIQTAATNIVAIQQAPQQAANAAASATLSESWAVGGTGTRIGEDTDNAKYYAGLAQQVSQGAVGYYETDAALKAAHPAGQNGQWAIVGATDTIWIWDSDTSDWVDSGSNMDLSQYYTKTEADTRFGTVQQVQQAQSAATAAQSTADNAQSAAEQAQATANAAAAIEKIWENPYPTAEYAAQTISVPGLAAYDMIIIFTNANALPYAYTPPTMAPKMGANEISVTSYQGTFTRGFTVNFAAQTIAIGDAHTTGIDNRYLVPALIFGIKF